MRLPRALSIVSITILLVAEGVSAALCQQSAETAAHIITSTPGSDLVHAVATDCYLCFVIEEDRFSLADGNVAGAESRPGRKLK